MPTDKGTYHSYLDLYRPLFEPLKESATDILEIGIADGSSLQLWYEWFPNATIHGVDINAASSPDPRLHLIHGSAISPEVVSLLSKTTYDLIIDDGSHILAEQIMALSKLSPFLKPNALFIIEDIQGWNSSVRQVFQKAATDLSLNMIVLDRRPIKGTPDDILIILQKK